MTDIKIRSIFFDLGNVLVGVESEKFGNKMKAITGLSNAQLHKALVESGLIVKYELGFLNDDEFLNALCREMGVTLSQSEFFDAWSCMFPANPILPDDLISQLAKKYSLWVISNTNRMHFEFIRQHYDFLSHFQGWILSYEVGAAKPDPAIYSHALSRAKNQASEALFIDDQLINVESAITLGMDAFQFLSPGQLRQEFGLRHLLS
jgi:FMN phosphatase YigB (HAD superfamily)